MKINKSLSIFGLLCILIGITIFSGVQYAMHKTSQVEFCVSCHSMSYPKEEWEGSTHFSNRKGIRAECADCHVPNETWHYVKAKLFALKDIWFEAQGKLADQEKYESHRLEMAKQVWDDMKTNDSMTCKSCHSLEAMVLSEQSENARKMHKSLLTSKNTCIDCHKGIVHFMPETAIEPEKSQSDTSHHNIVSDTSTLYTSTITSAQLANGGEIRLMPYVELHQWKIDSNNVTATVKGWQQIGADSIVYAQLGQRITVAVIGEENKNQLQVIQTIHDSVTDSEWQEIEFNITVSQNMVTNSLSQLNQLGENLNQTHCSGCHSAINANHYTANQWIGVVNSMKDRTSMTKDETRKLTIYLQHNAKDVTKAH